MLAKFLQDFSQIARLCGQKRNPLLNERWGHWAANFDKVTDTSRQMVRDTIGTATVHAILSLASNGDNQIHRSELPLQLLNSKLFTVVRKFL